AHRTLMRAILEPHGLTVREAQTGPACLATVAEAAGSAGIDLIFLDIAMPGMSGWYVAANLRAQGYAGPIAM
ncbi:response regulator, partial [Escherichia coli]|nr:response regulator [Escherichia coli]